MVSISTINHRNEEFKVRLSHRAVRIAEEYAYVVRLRGTNIESRPKEDTDSVWTGAIDHIGGRSFI